MENVLTLKICELSEFSGRTQALQGWRVPGLPVHGRIQCDGYSANCGKSEALHV